MKKLLIVLALLLLPSTCLASIGVDKFAHAGVSYLICDQLHRNAGMNDFWAAFTTLCIGAAKEAWLDNEWDNGDFAADCAGALMYQIKF